MLIVYNFYIVSFLGFAFEARYWSIVRKGWANQYWVPAWFIPLNILVAMALPK